MKENFAEMFAESIKDINFQTGTIRQAEVLDITPDFIVVYAKGSKSEAYIPISEFRNQDNELEVAVGDLVDVVYETKSKEIKQVLEIHGEEINKSTLTKKLIEGKADEEIEINGNKIKLTIKK